MNCGSHLVEPTWRKVADAEPLGSEGGVSAGFSGTNCSNSGTNDTGGHRRLRYDLGVVKRFALKFAAIASAWSLLAVVWAVDMHARLLMAGRPDQFGSRLLKSLLDYWIYAALTPLVFWVARRFRFMRGAYLRALLAHAGCFFVFSALHLVASSLLQLPGAPEPHFSGARLRTALLLNFYNDVWMFWPLVVIWNLIDYYHRYRERDLIAARLQTELARAQLDLLRAQIHPHFLFNTLNSIAGLMHEDVNAADDMLNDLSYMLRQALDSQTNQEITLDKELELLEAYVRIQKRRFEERLEFTVDVTPSIREALVPAFVCQPLVENAIRHGVDGQSGVGKIAIKGFRKDTSVVLEIYDNGRGLPASYSEGVGLSNIRRRLAQLYGVRQSMNLASNEGRGVTVTIELPFQRAAGEPKREIDGDSNSNRGRRTAGTAAPALIPER